MSNLNSWRIVWNIKTVNWNLNIIVFFFSWVYEWILYYDCILNLNTYVNFVFPYRIPVLLLIIFLYFTYVWGISVWRRTQYGKFTRGDRKLWYKGFASFWVVELSTLLGLVIAAAWMNWGPTPLFPRNFYSSKKSFVIELTFITYILWALYLLRFSIKWKKWKTQVSLTVFVIFIVILLIWRDILILVGRENININNGVRWKFIRANIVTYSLLPNWWFYTLINNKGSLNYQSMFFSLYNYLNALKIDTKITPIDFKITFNDYYKHNFLPAVLDINLNSKLNINSDVRQLTKSSLSFYPRRFGFLTKRIAMWTFFLFLKIWHHLMLYIWWFFYLIRLFSRKKNSYQFLSICHFNVYCCFLIALAIYIYGFFPKFMIFFRFFKPKPAMMTIYRVWAWKYFIANYPISLFEAGCLRFKNKMYIRDVLEERLI